MLPVVLILGKLPVVPVGDTGQNPFSMLQHAADFVCSSATSAFASETKDGARDEVAVHQKWALRLELVTQTYQDIKKVTLYPPYFEIY